MPFTDDFTGTTGQTLESRTGWAVGVGQSCFTITASGTVAKNSGTASAFNTIWRNPDDGATNQRIVCDILSANIGPIVFGDGSGNGYGLRVVSGTSLRLIRILNGVPVATSLATAAITSGVAAEIRAYVSGSTTVVEMWQAGALLATYTDSGQTNPRLTGGRRGLFASVTGSVASGIDNFTDNSVLPSNLNITETLPGFVWEGVRAASAISYAGAYATTPASIEARIVTAPGGTALAGYDWSVKVASPTGGAFTVAFADVPTGGPYYLQLRDSAVPGTVTESINPFYVGAVVWLWGQSQQSKLTTDQLGAVTGSAGSKAFVMRIPDKTAPGVPGVLSVASQSASLGEGIVALANQWVADTGNVPAMFIDCTFPGTSIDDWIGDAFPSGPAATWRTWSGIFAAYQAAARSQGSAVLWRQGTAGVSDYASYAAKMDILAAMFDAGLNGDPLHIVMPHPRSGDGPNTWNMRNVQYAKAASGGRWRQGPVIIDIAMDGDNSPHQAAGATGFRREGTRQGRGAAKYLHNALLDIAGPRISSAVLAAGGSKIILTFDRTIETPSGATTNLPGFYVADDGVSFPAVPSGYTAAITAANKVELTRASGTWTTNARVDMYRGVPFSSGATDPDYVGAEASVEANYLSKVITDASAFDGGRGVPAQPGPESGHPVTTAARVDFVATSAAGATYAGSIAIAS